MKRLKNSENSAFNESEPQGGEETRHCPVTLIMKEMVNASAAAVVRMMERTRYQHMQVRSGPNNPSVRTSVFAPAGVAGQWVADVLNTAAEVPLRHCRLAKGRRRRYAR